MLTKSMMPLYTLRNAREKETDTRASLATDQARVKGDGRTVSGTVRAEGPQSNPGPLAC